MFKLTSEDQFVIGLCICWIFFCGMVLSTVITTAMCGCDSARIIEKPLLPKIKIEEEPIIRPKPIISVKGPIIVDDLARCMNVPPDIVCPLFGDFGELVICSTECGVITCVPGAVILCPSGLCYTADP